jgi:DNA-binding NtrC family response regulator
MVQVLLIEDDALLRSTLCDILEEQEIEVSGLANAEDALILLSAGAAPDVLVTDINLGEGLSGFDLADIARSRHPEVEIILISGTVPSDDVSPLRLHTRFLAKPFDPASLADAIRKAANVGTGPRRKRGGPGSQAT